MASISLRDKTLKLLKKRCPSVTFYDIAKDTGLDVNWLKSFNKDLTKHPSVVRIQTLYEYLTGTKLITK